MIKLADGRGLLYQWDTGRQVECDAEQVHFSNHHYGTSIDVNVQNGKATIPNQLLTSATPLKAWAWVRDSNVEYTKEDFRLNMDFFIFNSDIKLKTYEFFNSMF